MDPGTPVNGPQLLVQGLPAVGHGLEVGHGAHGGVAACRGRGRTGGDGLLIRKTRLPKMDMNINETWHQKPLI